MTSIGMTFLMKSILSEGHDGFSRLKKFQELHSQFDMRVQWQWNGHMEEAGKRLEPRITQKRQACWIVTSRECADTCWTHIYATSRYRHQNCTTKNENDIAIDHDYNFHLHSHPAPSVTASQHASKTMPVSLYKMMPMMPVGHGRVGVSWPCPWYRYVHVYTFIV